MFKSQNTMNLSFRSLNEPYDNDEFFDAGENYTTQGCGDRPFLRMNLPNYFFGCGGFFLLLFPYDSTQISLIYLINLIKCIVFPHL